MFHNIPERVLNRMRFLEQIDSKDRADDTPRMERLRQIEPETGKFLAILAASAPEGKMIEIGTSAGYSALWLSLAARATGRKLTTFESLDPKIALAQETFRKAGVEDLVELVKGNALDHLGELEDISFCFLDAEKEVYPACYDHVIPKLVPGGILVADNIISHAETLESFAEMARSDPRVDALVVPIGKGELVCRKL